MKRSYLLALLLISFLSSRATVYYVDGTASGSNNGSSWTNAYKTLAQAMNAVQTTTTTDSILVAQGTYYPAGTAAGNATTKDSAFTILRGGIKLYGGYPNGGGSARNLTAYPVYLDGTASSYHVMVIAGIPANADSVVIDGFTIRNGMAETNSTKIYNGQAVNKDYRAGLYQVNDTHGSNTVIRNCSFNSNSAYLGGGMFTDGSSPALINCRFSGNTADPVIYGGLGGALYLGQGGAPAIMDCSFSGNTATIGGVIYNLGAAPIINRSSFTNNTATTYAGAMYSAAGVFITNCVFYANTAAEGSAMYYTGGPVIANCTFFGNIATTSGGGALFNDLTNPAITNCIIYGNVNGGAAPAGAANPQDITYSIVQDGYTGTSGTGNSSSDPLFINASNPAGADGIFGTIDDGLQLNYGSPAINTGSNTAIAGTTTDLHNLPRIANGTVDMGAYERQSNTAPDSNLAALSTASVNNTSFIKAFDDGTWTYYAIPDNPDSVAFAIAWNGNTAAGNAATVSINVTDSNTAQNNTTSGMWAMRRYWNVDLHGQVLANPVKLRFYYAAADTLAMAQAAAVAGLPQVSSIKWFKTVGTAYTPSLITPNTISGTFIALHPSATGTQNKTAWVEFSNITSFSGGTAIVSAGGAIPLPVHLLSFDVQKGNDATSAVLNWHTGVETQLSKYEIQHATDGKTYTVIGNIAAAGKAEYTFTDNAPVPGKNYYRLNMTDLNGSNNLSITRLLDLGACTINISAAPNPARSVVTISGLTTGMSVRITAPDGRTANSQTATAAVETMDISNLANGVYLVEIIQNGMTVSRIKMVKE